MVNPSAATTTQPVAALAAIDLRPSELPYRAQETGENGDGTSGRHTALVRPAGESGSRRCRSATGDLARWSSAASSRAPAAQRRYTVVGRTTRLEQPRRPRSLPEVRRLIAAGEYAAAMPSASRCRAIHPILPAAGRSHRPIHDDTSPPAIAATWTFAPGSPGVQSQGDVTFAREVFASAPDQVIVVRLSADRPGASTSRRRSTRHTSKASKRSARADWYREANARRRSRQATYGRSRSSTTPGEGMTFTSGSRRSRWRGLTPRRTGCTSMVPTP